MRRSLRQCLQSAMAVLCVCISTALASNVLAQTRIAAGMVAHGPPQWPQYIAAELGWLREDKIELDLISVGGGGAQQLAGGSLNIAHSGFPDFARASLQGAPVKMIINDIVASPYAVFAKPGIKSIADLRGKLISIGGVKDVTLIYIKAFLASAGLQTSDVDFVYAKAAGDRLSALISGGVDATILNPPTYFKAASLGFTNLGDVDPYIKDVPFTVWAANTDWAAKNRDVLVAFARSYKRGVRWLYDPANKGAAVDILVKHAKQDRNDTVQAYDYLVTRLNLFSFDGSVPGQRLCEDGRRPDRSGRHEGTGAAEIGNFRRQLCRTGRQLTDCKLGRAIGETQRLIAMLGLVKNSTQPTIALRTVSIPLIVAPTMSSVGGALA